MFDPPGISGEQVDSIGTRCGVYGGMDSARLKFRVSPNSQACAVISTVDASVKATVNGTGPEVGVYGEPGNSRSCSDRDVSGLCCGVRSSRTGDRQVDSIGTRSVYWWDGLCSVEVPVSPNSQACAVIDPRLMHQ